MFNWENIKIMLYKEEVDFRRGLDGLCYLVSEAGQNPADGTLYLFTNRKHDKLKGIWYDGVSFYLIYRRLNSGVHQWKLVGEDLVSIDANQMDWLIKGYPVQSTILYEERRPRYF